MLFLFARQYPCSGPPLSPPALCPLAQSDALRFQDASEPHGTGAFSLFCDEAIFRLTNHPPWNTVQPNKKKTKEFNTKRKRQKDEGIGTKDRICSIHCAKEGGNAVLRFPHFHGMLGLREPFPCGDSLAVG